MRRRVALVASLLSTLLVSAQAQQAVEKIRIGVLNDMSSIYSDSGGAGSVVAAKLAVEDFLKENPGFAVEVVSADHQNKTDVGSAIARKWYDTDSVGMIIDIPNSSVALAVADLAKRLDKVVIISGAGTTRLTGDHCTPNTVHWQTDTYASSRTAKTVSGQGKDRWFFLTADYAFGLNLEENAASTVRANGLQVAGSARHPFNSSDFSSYLLQAQSSGANVLGFANAGGDFSSSVKQAVEFGLPKKMALAALWGGLADVHSIGLETAQGMYFVTAYYWDLNDRTRSLNRRFIAQHKKTYMTEQHAGVYGGTLHYLRAVAAAKSQSGVKVVAQMKAIPVNDVFGAGSVRADGRKLHEMHLLQVKSPKESKGAWDYFKPVRAIPASEAFLPPSRDCSLVK